MLERLALIVANHIDFYGTAGRGPLPGESFGREAFSDGEMAVSTSAVRAVIEALMEPTDEMLAAVQREITGYPRPEAVIAIWQVLLHTILSQPNDEGEGK